MNEKALPMTMDEALDRGWDSLDVILVTGDSYVDHPSFGVAVVGRYLQSLGLSVGLLASPDKDNIDDFKKLGCPNLFFGVTAGNLDSMIMLRTALNKHRSDDAYVAGGKAGRRPPRATLVYCNKLRQAYKGVGIVIGGLEASLRRFTHYDYWSDKVRRSILQDSKADLLVYGMAERPLDAIVTAMREGKSLKELKNIPGTAVMISNGELDAVDSRALEIPSYEAVISDKKEYAAASKQIHLNQNPYSARPLAQDHGDRYLLVNPPALPLSTEEIDGVYALPFTRRPHHAYSESIPAWEMIRDSIIAMRGCFGGCSFCSLTVHQGRAIQSRSKDSILKEVRRIAKMEDFKGYVSDIGGPTANMYEMVCGQPEVEAVCRRLSCVHPKVCSRLVTGHEPQIEMLEEARSIEGVKKVFISSGVRYDLANQSPEYIRQLACHHVSGQLKVAPEHCNSKVLGLMRKPSIESYEKFVKNFLAESKKAGLEQYVIPYFISAHPGCGIAEEVEMAEYLKERNIKPRQVQDFIPVPMTLSADIYYCGFDPISRREVKTDTGGKERRLHRALMQYFKPENEGDVSEALKRVGKKSLGQAT
ncbi:UPF0313 [4Fe-4S] protein YgiQ [hydrothermal vent metagenome]|uniref:UPF0313 [4Fe-4S] protein YgiQ n=1 Tax=hydrothermal vent metagenome TaxID=652676 RepID=A0A3B1CEU6_9ZZZZ